MSVDDFGLYNDQIDCNQNPIENHPWIRLGVVAVTDDEY